MCRFGWWQIHSHPQRKPLLPQVYPEDSQDMPENHPTTMVQCKVMSSFLYLFILCRELVEKVQTREKIISTRTCSWKLIRRSFPAPHQYAFSWHWSWHWHMQKIFINIAQLNQGLNCHSTRLSLHRQSYSKFTCMHASTNIISHLPLGYYFCWLGFGLGNMNPENST